MKIFYLKREIFLKNNTGKKIKITQAGIIGDLGIPVKG